MAVCCHHLWPSPCTRSPASLLSADGRVEVTVLWEGRDHVRVVHRVVVCCVSNVGASWRTPVRCLFARTFVSPVTLSCNLLRDRTNCDAEFPAVRYRVCCTRAKEGALQKHFRLCAGQADQRYQSPYQDVSRLLFAGSYFLGCCCVPGLLADIPVPHTTKLCEPAQRCGLVYPVLWHLSEAVYLPQPWAARSSVCLPYHCPRLQWWWAMARLAILPTLLSCEA